MLCGCDEMSRVADGGEEAAKSGQEDPEEAARELTDYHTLTLSSIVFIMSCKYCRYSVILLW